MGENLIWLASYPKSGNTWLRYILQEILAPDVQPATAIPALNKKMPETAPLHEVMGTVAKIVKTHCHPGNPRLAGIEDKAIGIITIHRHPLDVLLSTLNYLALKKKAFRFKNDAIKSVEKIIADGEIDYYVDQFIENDGCPEYKLLCGPWSQYYASWCRAAEGIAHLNIRYEAMVAEPLEHIERLGQFIGRPVPSVAALAARVEERTKVNGKFFWKKRAYNFRKMLPAKSIERFEHAYSDVLGEMSYATSSVGSQEAAPATIPQ